jgi:hypothetical protein
MIKLPAVFPHYFKQGSETIIRPRKSYQKFVVLGYANIDRHAFLIPFVFHEGLFCTGV